MLLARRSDTTAATILSQVAKTDISATVFGESGDFAIYEVSPTQFFLIGIDDEDSPLGIFTPQTLPQQAEVRKPATTAPGVTSTKPAVKKAAAHHSHPRPNAAKPTQLPAR